MGWRNIIGELVRQARQVSLSGKHVSRSKGWYRIVGNIRFTGALKDRLESGRMLVSLKVLKKNHWIKLMGFYHQHKILSHIHWTLLMLNNSDNRYHTCLYCHLKHLYIRGVRTSLDLCVPSAETLFFSYIYSLPFFLFLFSLFNLNSS